MAVEHVSNDDTKCNWRACNGPQIFEKGTRKIENWRTNRDHANYSIVEIAQNTEKKSSILEETGCHAGSSERPSVIAGGKNR